MKAAQIADLVERVAQYAVLDEIQVEVRPDGTTVHTYSFGWTFPGSDEMRHLTYIEDAQ